MAEERGFDVVDKRRAAGAAPEAEADAVSDTAEADVEEEEAFTDAYGDMGEGFQNPLAGMTVGHILRMTVGMLNERAWAGMGLVPDPMSGKIEQNLSDAKRAIDVIADLARHLETDATPEERRELQVMLTNLRLNFVRQSG